MTDQTNWNEANITINGQVLTQRQSMTIRVALETFSGSLRGSDAMTKAYLDNIQAIRAIMYATEGG